MKKKYENSPMDKAVDKMVGAREGSKADEQMDKMMEGSHYKHTPELGKAMEKTFRGKKK